MADITNQDILNAIRGLYQNPNRVVDNAAIAKLQDIVDKLSANLPANVTNWPAIQNVKAEDTDTELELIKSELELINNKLTSGIGVSDADALAELELIKTELEAIKTRLNNALDVEVKGSNMEHYGLSTDPKPTTGLVKGMTFFEIDTTDVYMWDGTQWRLI